MFGVPSGLSGKYYVGSDTAIDFGFGTYYRHRYDSAVNLHADFLWHPLVLAQTEPFWLPLYFGLGARFLDHGNDRDRNHDTHVGLRVPLGIAFDFNNVPLDIFLEVAFVLDFIREDGHGYSDFNTAFGLRYYFN